MSLVYQSFQVNMVGPNWGLLPLWASVRVSRPGSADLPRVKNKKETVKAVVLCFNGLFVVCI
ncbi:hypothetical protein, partial [Corynebacterium sp. HMSC068H04]